MFEIQLFDLSIFLISILLVLLWIRSRKPSNFPPGPTPLPLIGNLYNISGKEHIVKHFRRLRKEYGDVFSLSIGPHWVTVVNGIEALRELFIKKGEFTADRPPLYLMEIFKNRGILSGSGQSWKHQRTFTISKLRDFGFGKKSFETSIMEEVQAFADLMSSYQGKPFDFEASLNTSMVNNVMLITIGRRFNYDDPKCIKFVHTLNKTAQSPALVGPVNFLPILARLPLDIFGVKELPGLFDKIDEFFLQEVVEHEQSFDENNIRDFIDAYLLEIKSKGKEECTPYKVEELVAVIHDLFAGGTETTATAVKWAVVFLLNNMNIQNKMRKEIDDIIGHGRPPKLSDRSNLPYCEAVINETLRLGNIGFLSLPHMVTDDIKYNGYTIPRNSVIIPCLDSVTYDEILFPDSHVFKPERFLDKDGRLVGHQKIAAFSLGRRICLGESLARMELFLYLITFLQRFEIKPVEGESAPSTEPVYGVSCFPQPFKFRAIPRN